MGKGEERREGEDVRDKEARQYIICVDRIVDQLATKANVSLRVGCFCNPGIAQVALRIPTSTLVTCVVKNVVHPSTHFYLRREIRANLLC